MSDSLFHEESVDGLLFPDELDNQTVQVDKQSPTKTTGNTAERETHTYQKVETKKVFHLAKNCILGNQIETRIH